MRRPQSPEDAKRLATLIGVVVHREDSPSDVGAPGSIVQTDRAQGEQTKTDSSIVPLADQLRKAREKLRAQLALQGHELHVLADGGFLVVSRAWGLARECADLEEVEAFARRLGGRP